MELAGRRSRCLDSFDEQRLLCQMRRKLMGKDRIKLRQPNERGNVDDLSEICAAISKMLTVCRIEDDLRQLR
jgi:hypothetical protein